MALSNIRKEPRREIIEILLGFLTLWPVIPWYYLAKWICIYAYPPALPLRTDDIIVMMCFMVLVVFCIWIFGHMFLYTVHFCGESLCAWMARRGFDPRPKDRPFRAR